MGEISVYVDHHNEPLFDWIDEQKAEEGIDSESSDEDIDSVMSDALSVHLELDEEVVQPTLTGDPFLSHISVIPRDDVVDVDDDSDNGNKQVPIFHFHEPNQK
ncbi:unnamed protein product [Lactuca virosa]|uniref:Uncharacterized protein n=1 Tax=Lactuca virosa TaxID=75947 RepID=A0AAU9LG25_9ASTR|nr:unnamed protein product [Lactuca virosa]